MKRSIIMHCNLISILVLTSEKIGLILHIKLKKYEFIVFINTKLLQIYFMDNFKVAAILGDNGCSGSTT